MMYPIPEPCEVKDVSDMSSSISRRPTNVWDHGAETEQAKSWVPAVTR